MIAAALFSCQSGVTNHLTSGQLPGSGKYSINKYAGCCGCRAEYVDIYEGGKRQEQIIYQYNCYNPGMPTKFNFKYDSKGRLLYCEKFVATVDNDAESVLTKKEKHIFDMLDKDKSIALGDKTIRFADVKGFRKTKEGEPSHAFPLVKGGSGVTVK